MALSGAGWFVFVLVVLGFLALFLVFVIDVLFPTPDPVAYAASRVPAAVAGGISDGSGALGALSGGGDGA